MKVSDKFEWYLVFAYDCGNNKRGDIYSKHKSYETAERKCKTSVYNTHLAIRHHHEISK